MKAKLIPSVWSINELYMRAQKDPRYKKLAFLASGNLGGSGNQTTDLWEAIQWLRTNAQETDEAGVVEEINFCRDLIG